MARSVSTHRNAYETVYLNDPAGDADVAEDYFAEENWADFIINLRDIVMSAYPSFEQADRWVDREDHVILENRHAEVTVSEYCGLVAVCLAPLGEDQFNYNQSRTALAEAWTRNNADKFGAVVRKAFSGCALVSMGHASNGEQFFALAEEPGSCVTSKEGRLW